MSTDNLNEKIAQRAYELFLERGSQAGSETEDWLRAEREVRAKSSGSSAKSVSMTSTPAAAVAPATKSAAFASPAASTSASSASSAKKTPLKKK